MIGAHRRSSSPWFAAACAVLLGAALVVLLANLTVATAGVDEVTYARAGWDYVHGDRPSNREHPFLSKLVLGGSQLLLGQTLLGVRLPGVLFAAATGLLVGWLGWRLAGRWAGLAGAALWLLPPQAPGSVVLRLDRYGALEPPMVFFMMLGCVLAVVTVRRGSVATLLAAAAAVGLAGAAKWPAVVAVAPVALAVACFPVSWRRRAVLGLGAVAAAVAAFVAVYWATGDWTLSAFRYALDFQTNHGEVGHPQLVAGTVYQVAPWWANWWWQQTYLGVTATVAWWMAAVAGLWTAARGARRRTDLVAQGVVAVLVVGCVVFVLAMPIRLPGYHLVWVAPLSVAAGVGLANLARAGAVRRLLALVLAAPVALAAAHGVATAVQLQRTDYGRLPAVFAREHVRSGPVLVWGWPRVADWHLGPRYEVVNTLPKGTDPVAVVVDPVTSERFPESRTADQVAAKTPGCDRLQVDRLLVYICRTSGPAE